MRWSASPWNIWTSSTSYGTGLPRDHLLVSENNIWGDWRLTRKSGAFQPRHPLCTSGPNKIAFPSQSKSVTYGQDTFPWTPFSICKYPSMSINFKHKLVCCILDVIISIFVLASKKAALMDTGGWVWRKEQSLLSAWLESISSSRWPLQLRNRWSVDFFTANWV